MIILSISDSIIIFDGGEMTIIKLDELRRIHRQGLPQGERSGSLRSHSVSQAQKTAGAGKIRIFRENNFLNLVRARNGL